MKGKKAGNYRAVINFQYNNKSDAQTDKFSLCHVIFGARNRR